MPRPFPITRPSKRKPKGSGHLPDRSTPSGGSQGPSSNRREQIERVVAHRRAKKQPNLNRPLFPGGITTVGEFLEGRKAAENAEFRPQEQQLNDQAQTIPAWYQDFLAKMQGLQAQTVEQYQGLQGQAASLNEPVQAGQTESGTAAADARNNLVKAIQGSLITQQGAQLNKIGSYSAIATAKKGQKEDEIAKARKELAQRRGEFRTKYTAEHKQTEFENALAAKQFGLKRKETLAGINAEKNKPKPETTYQKEFSKQAAKYGYSPHDWALLGPKGRAKKIAEEQRRSGKRPESLGRIQAKEQIKIAAKNGYTLEQWRKLPPQKRAAIIRKEGSSAKKEDGTELSFRTGEQRGKAAGEAASWKGLATALKEGAGVKGINAKGHKRTRAEIAKTILADPKAPEPVVVSALLDSLFVGFVSRDTAKRLHSSGLKVDEIAQALGVPTFTQWSKKNQTPGNRQKRPT